MKRGPKTKPKQDGKPGPLPDPPEWLGDVGVEHWERYGPTLNRLGLLESLDALAFGLLCDAIDAYLRAREELSAEELVILTGKENYPTQNPLVSIVRQQSKAIRELLSEFGMTPSSRTNLTGSTSCEPPDDERDPLEQLVSQMGSSQSQSAEPPKPPRRRAKKKTTAKKATKKKAATKKRTRKKS